MKEWVAFYIDTYCNYSYIINESDWEAMVKRHNYNKKYLMSLVDNTLNPGRLPDFGDSRGMKYKGKVTLGEWAEEHMPELFSEKFFPK